MHGGVRGFLITLGIWVFLTLTHMTIEWIGGRSPLAMFAREPRARYIAITVAVVLALGTAIGVASDRVRRRAAQTAGAAGGKEESAWPG